MSAASHAPDPVEVARHLADDVLFPAALETDRAEAVPRRLLDRLAHEGMYGLAGPRWAGGMDADLATACAVIETLASGCLTTTFVWAQHVSTVFVVGASRSPAVRRLAPALCDGELRAGLALTGSLPGSDQLFATRVDEGWTLTGACPWVSGWGRIDLVHTAALADDGSVVWALVDAHEGADLEASRTSLAALDATATVDLRFESLLVPDDRVTLVTPPAPPSSPDPATLRRHAALALGVTVRCCRLFGPSPLDAELDACRRALADADADAESMPAARAAASELAVRAAAALMASTGSTSLLLDRHPQRLAREALFTSVFATSTAIREAYLTRLVAASDDG